MPLEMPLQVIEPQSEEEALSERLQIFGVGLQRRIDERVAARSNIEDRWLEDLRQYHGVLTNQEESSLTKSKKSKVVVNITRNKATAAEARIVELISPTDDKNFGIRPTPVPELSDKMYSEEEIELPTGEKVQAGQLADDIMKEAKKRAAAMEREIDDQLTEARYQAECRDMIHDGVVLGTGIMKGPIVVDRTRQKWAQREGFSILEIIQDFRPGVMRVSPWDFFPDLNARDIRDSEDEFERLMLNKSQLRKLAKQPGYLKDQLRALIEEGPSKVSSYDKVNQIREITGAGSVDLKGFYELWEYHGPVEREDLLAAGMEEDDLPDDPLIEHRAIVVFCQNRVLKVSMNPLETGDKLYSVWNWSEDETSIFGFGVPYRMRNPQKVINASFRMILDNGSLSVGPQIVMDKESVVPADGKWEITGRKLWFKTDRNKSVRDIFGLYEINSHQVELLNIFTQARKLADEETNLPVIAQGDMGAEATKTKGGLQLLQKNSDIVIRRAVRAFDDDITATIVKRFYDWNMQNSDKEEIKGDFEIQPRGMAYMTELEIAEQGIQELIALAAHPVFGPMTDAHEMYRRVCKARKIDPDGLVKDPQEMEKNAGPSPGEIEIQVKMQELKLKEREIQIKEAELINKRQRDEAELSLKYRIELNKMALQERVTMDQLYQRLDLDKRKLDIELEKIKTTRQVEGIKAQNVQNELSFKATTGRQGI